MDEKRRGVFGASHMLRKTARIHRFGDHVGVAFASARTTDSLRISVDGIAGHTKTGKFPSTAGVGVFKLRKRRSDVSAGSLRVEKDERISPSSRRGGRKREGGDFSCRRPCRRVRWKETGL